MPLAYIATSDGVASPCSSTPGARVRSSFHPIYEFTFNIVAKSLFIKVLCCLYNIEAKSLFGNRNFVDPLSAFTYSGAGWEKVG